MDLAPVDGSVLPRTLLSPNAVFTGLPPAKNRQKIGAAPVER